MEPVTTMENQQATRSVPMEVICVGMPRTGTSSMKTALAELGYSGVYHMHTCMKEQPSHAEKWNAAFRAKYEGEGEPFGREQWDEFLGDYMALTDVPPMSFWKELLEAYPDAKVILSVRDVDSWYKSVKSTIWRFSAQVCAPGSDSWNMLLRSVLPSKSALGMLGYVSKYTLGDDFVENGRQTFLDHNEAVRQFVPKERILEMDVKEGWEPLCKFLNKPVPETPFPRTNDGADFQKKFGAILP